MTYTLTIHEKPTYLHAIVTGLNSRETVQRYLQEVGTECLARGCFRLLLEERLEGPRLGLLDVFKIASEGSPEVSGMFKAFAYVDVNAQGDLMQFAETVAVNRRLPLAVFSNVADAEQWLLNEGRLRTGAGGK
jgi:hypothetical protein